MKSYDFDAVVYDGEIYCIGCLPKIFPINRDDVHPIFADSEWGYYPVCTRCGKEHDYMSLIEER